MCVCVCLFVCLFVCLLACLLACLFVVAVQNTWKCGHPCTAVQAGPRLNDVKGKRVEAKATKLESTSMEIGTGVCIHPRQNSPLESLTTSPY